MTDSAQPNDINTRLDDIDERLEQLGDELDLIRTIQNGSRRELRTNSQTVARLERTVTELSNIARLHQQALRESQRNFDRIWRLLEGRGGGNGSNPPGGS